MVCSFSSKVERKGSFNTRDSGYSWMICFASSSIMIIMMGNVRSFGVLLSALQKEFNASTSMISTILGVEYGANCIAAFIVMNGLSAICSIRLLVIIGTFLSAICFILDSQANNVIMMPFYHILNGAGIAFMFGPSVVIIGYYFKKYRGTANALASLGSSIGQFILSPVFSLMESEYGIKGALLLNSGFFLQCLVFAMFFRPIDSNSSDQDPPRTRPVPKSTELENYEKEELIFKSKLDELETDDLDSVPRITGNCRKETGSDCEPITDQNIINKRNQLHKTESNHSNPFDKQNGLDFNSLDRSIEKVRFEVKNPNSEMSGMATIDAKNCNSKIATIDTQNSNSEMNTIDEKSSDLEKATIDTKNSNSKIVTIDANNCDSKIVTIDTKSSNSEMNTIDTKNHDSKIDAKNSYSKLATTELSLIEKKTPKNPLWRQMISNMNFNLFRKKIYIVYFFASTAAMVCTSVPQSFFPSHSKDLGLGSIEGAYFVSLAGFGDLGGRLLTMLLADKKFINRSRCLGISLLIHGIAGCFIPLYVTFGSFSYYCVVYGFSGGIYFAISTTILTDFIGIGQLSQGLGLVFFFVGIIASILYPALGYLRDITGSYNTGLVMNSGGLIISGLLFLSEAFITYEKHSNIV